MKKPDIPVHEPTRMAALCGLAILDTPAEERFDRVTRIAQRHFQVPITLVSLVDAERQWFKSRQGLGASETPRDISFCGHAILSEDILYIPNALDDPRFADNPLVTGAPNIRFYAGAPVHAPGGERVGTLCIIDDQPRTFSAAELSVLRDLAGCVEVELERTRITEAAHEAHRFQQILDKARDMIFMFDANTLQFVYLNQGAVQSMGYTREELLQLHPYDIKPQFPEPAFRQLIAPLLSGEREALQFETAHRRKDGVDFPVEIYLQLVREAEGVGRFVAIVRDITERKHIESDLRSSENRIRAIIDTVVDGIISIDSKGNIQTVNPAAEKLFGYGHADMLGRNVNFLMPEPFHSAHDGYLHNYLVTGNKKIIGIGREVTGRRADGSTFPMELAVSEMEVNGERMFTGIVRDITERKNMEEASKQLAERLGLATRSAGIGIWDWDISKNHLLWDDRMFELYGAKREGFGGAYQTWLAGVHPDDRARCDQRIGMALKGEAPYDIEFRVLWPDGTLHEIKASGLVMRNPQGEPLRMTGINYDITESKRVEKMKREFISTVSHELRTPLTSIRGALGLVAGGATGAIPDKAKELVTIASNNCDRLVRLINDILDMEKIESGKMTFDMRPVDLRGLIEEAVAANQAYAAPHRVTIAVEGELPPVEIIGDRDRLIQVLTNLLSNAAKFTAPGGTVYVSLAETPGVAMLRVRDEGPGIPEEFQPRIFQKFSQADSSDTRSKGGSGLGLSITKAIVEHHDGQIGFETVAGQGAIFWVSLPAQPAAEAGEHPPGQARVLVVEDDQDVAKLLRLILEQEGYAVDVAYSIAQARERLESGRYAAMTLDLLLPGESGMSFLRELRERPESVALPIVVVSAVVEHGRKELNGAAVSVLDWLEKPIDEERLLKAVAEAVQVSGGKRRVLHVEDDADIAHVLSAMLEGIAELDLAPTLKQAHACLDSNDYALVILDIGLPDGSGLDLLPRLAQIKPPIPILVFSAQELNAHDSRQVSAVFVKSRTDTDRLVRAIRTRIAARDTGFVK